MSNSASFYEPCRVTDKKMQAPTEINYRLRLAESNI